MKTIYFPAISAYATNVDVTRGAHADVCHGFQKMDGAYIGRIDREKFTTVQPKNFMYAEYALLTQVPKGGFCYVIYD